MKLVEVELQGMQGLNESNKMLREEKKSLNNELRSVNLQLTNLQNEIAPLQARSRELSAQLVSAKVCMSLLDMVTGRKNLTYYHQPSCYAILVRFLIAMIVY